LCTRHGAVDKRPVDACGEATEHLLEGINHPSRLHQQALEFPQKGTIGVGLEIDPVPITAAAENAGVNQSGEFSLEAGRANIEVLGEITEIPPPIGVEHGSRQERLPYPRKESIKSS
jgi:hypothetical protein